MAASSLGKLDAICARLKSQQPTAPADSSITSSAAAERFQINLDPSEKVKVAGGDGVDVKSNGSGPNVKVKVKSGLLDLGRCEAPPIKDEEQCLAVDEETKCQSSEVEGQVEASDKHVSINNNNNCEATDYNDVAPSAQCTTFHAADSTIVASDSSVSSTTAEPPAINESIPASKSYSSTSPFPAAVTKHLADQASTSESPSSASVAQNQPSLSPKEKFAHGQTESAGSSNDTSRNSEQDQCDIQRIGSREVVVEDVHGNSVVTSSENVVAGAVRGEVGARQFPPIPSTSHDAEEPYVSLSSSSTSNSSSSSSCAQSVQDSVDRVKSRDADTVSTDSPRDETASTCKDDVGVSQHEDKCAFNSEQGTKPDVTTPSEDSLKVALEITKKNPLVDSSGKSSSNGVCSMSAEQDGSSSQPTDTTEQNLCNEQQNSLTSHKTPQQPAEPKSGGRRKSRKAARPQKQVTGFYSNLQMDQEFSFGNPDLTNLGDQSMGSDLVQHKEQCGVVEMKGSGLSDLDRCPEVMTSSQGCDSENQSRLSHVEHFLSPPNAASPLDLSVGSSGSQILDRSMSKPPSDAPVEICNHFLGNIEDPADNLQPKSDVPAAQNDPGKIGSSVESVSTKPDADEPKPSTIADTKVLVDFAHNTMKELLGIYGFEGADTKGVNINHLQNFQPEKVTQFPTNAESKPVTTLEVKDKPRREGVGLRSGPFKKNVYTSLMSHTAGTASNGEVNSVKSLPQEKKALSSSAGYKPSVSTTSAKYALSKRNYTQRVLNSADFSKYIKRYGNGMDCGGKLCQDLGYRDHYHCLDCPHKVFVRKEEMVRHYKWHKKRHDSLQHGFMRYSPMDDCSKKYGNCTHNGRQTHYHCVQKGCDKVYISTSDVQMHANFHRKDSAIIQEGFQRFRATEDCGTTSCAFYGQRTTHFHCRRPQCNFTFKNKADMEKHKSYHQKDEVLSKDGFKKYMKYESCPYTGCRYSKISNHIHCIRPGCQYVLHSTAQLYSHKRKHERREFENAFRRLQQQQQQQKPLLTTVKVEGGAGGSSSPLPASQVSPSQTKLLPLPSVVTNGQMVAGVPLLATGLVPNQQGLQLGSSSTPTLINNLTTKVVPAQGYTVIGAMDPNAPPLGVPLHQAKQIVGGGVSAALNLTNQIGMGGVKVLGMTDEGRETMALPVRLVTDGHDSGLTDVPAEIKSEMDVPGAENIKSEPEDLSLSSKKRRNEAAVKSEPSISLDGLHKVDSEASTSALGDEDEDDEDDDDDDDKDYGQVEEPTLVNRFGSVLEGDKLNDSLNLPIPGQIAKEEAPKLKEVKKEEVAGENVVKFISAIPVPGQGGLVSNQQQPIQPDAPQALVTSGGKVFGVHIPVKLMPERRERDESWKKYLIRYTANDACFSRCACLYKDHYHCRMEGCQVIFKSKDGVRGHARFHELQDSVSPLVYTRVGAGTVCSVTGCQQSGKEHYHCNWTNCNHVIPDTAATFARLEHYRIHEYATAAVCKSRGGGVGGGRVELDPLQKRRGRPPKYPRYELPVVPKVHLTEKEIMDSTLEYMHNKFNENSKIINGFKKFTAQEQCPDDQCIYKGTDHYHCGRKFCHMSTDRMDVLNLHAREFHNNVTILEGFEFFERMVNCRRPVCHNNRINRHFHCMRPRCDYSFVRHSTMSQHNKKHPTVTSAVLSAPLTHSSPTIPASQKKAPAPQYVPIAPAVTSPPTSPSPSSPSASTAASATPTTPSKMVVKSSGTFFPLSGLSNLQLSTMSSTSVTSSQILTSGGTTQILSNCIQPLSNAPAAQVISGAQVLHASGGAPIFSAAGVCLTLPPNIVTTSIPVLNPTAQGQQPNLLAGIIPLGQISQHGLSSSLVGLSGGQIIATSQGHFLQNGSIIGTNLLQLIPSASAVTAIPTTNVAAAAAIHTASGTASTISTAATAAAVSPLQAPLTVLLQQHQQLQQAGLTSPLNWANLKKRMHYSVELSCGRPFCKLKKKDHYHCLDCNQAFSDPARLRGHIGKHGFKFKKSDHRTRSSTSSLGDSELMAKPVDLSLSAEKKDEVRKDEELSDDEDDEEELSSSLNLQPSVFTNMVTKDDDVSASVGGRLDNVAIISGTSSSLPALTQRKLRSLSSVHDDDDDDGDNDGALHISTSSDSKHEDGLDSPALTIDESMDEDNESSLNASSSSLTLCSSLNRKSGRKRTATKNEDFVSSDSVLIPKPAKHRKTQWGNRAETDLPEGYRRVRCGDDCGYVRCAYRQTVTHFHCLRADCGYGFSDKSRIMQHRIRHERLDALMGGEFQQFRASVSCERADCEFDEKASHFHCLKCPYSCADSSKVPAHRKYHTKLDNISSNGFTKFPGTADCQIASCSYFRKQTHYHCTFPGCNHAVLGPSQMAPHKLKHAQHQNS